MRISSIKKLNKGCIVATFNLCYAGLTIFGLRLMKNKDGKYFVTPPCKNIQGRWLSDIRISDDVKDIVLYEVMNVLDLKEE